MSEQPNPIMAMMLEHSSFLGASEVVENEIMPLPEQLSFGPGDAAVLATSNVALERDFTIVRGADPEKYARTFPDWEERMLNSYVLCQFFSREDPELSLGWFSRLKLLPIPRYRYWECRRWMKHGWPDELPDWVEKYFHKYTDALSKHAPDRVPTTADCPYCGEREVILEVTRRTTYTGRAGRLHIDGMDRYVPLADPEENGNHFAVLRCTSCQAYADLTDEEWHLPGLTNL